VQQVQAVRHKMKLQKVKTLLIAEEGDHCSALQSQLLTNLPLTSCTLTSFDFHVYRHQRMAYEFGDAPASVDN